MKQILEYLITTIVEKPEEVKIEEAEEDGIVRFSINLAKEDMGRVIGKEGKVIRSIRNVMKIPAMKHNIRMDIGLVEKE